MNLHIPAFSGRRGQIISDSAKIPQSSLGHGREIAEIISVRFPEENATFALTTVDVARGLRSATRTSTPDAGKSALTSFRGEPVSSTAPSREGFRMTRYQFFHNSYESLRLFSLILIATNPWHVDATIIAKCPSDESIKTLLQIKIDPSCRLHT